MMDVLLMELLKGGEINSVQARQVVNKEFSAVWNDKTPLSPLPDESKEDRSARFLTNVYLAAVKASFLDPENHGDGRNPRLKEDRWDSDL